MICWIKVGSSRKFQIIQISRDFRRGYIDRIDIPGWGRMSSGVTYPPKLRNIGGTVEIAYMWVDSSIVRINQTEVPMVKKIQKNPLAKYRNVKAPVTVKMLPGESPDGKLTEVSRKKYSGVGDHLVKPTIVTRAWGLKVASGDVKEDI